jgi:ABC-type branched-subunit amino acid transport system ATPase component
MQTGAVSFANRINRRKNIDAQFALEKMMFVFDNLELFKVFDALRQYVSIIIVEHNLDLVLALADRVFALERGAVFHEGPARALLTDLDYRKKILWL